MKKKEKILVVKMGVAKRTKVSRKDRVKAKLLEQPSPEDIEQAFTKFGLTKMIKKYKAGEIKDIDPMVIAQLLGRVHYKILALPIDPKYEPWTLDLCLHIKKYGELNWHLTRNATSRLIKQEFKNVGLGNWHAHNLRHQRVSDLINVYNLQPSEVTSVAGWTLRSTFQGMGQSVSSNLDTYASLNFRSYLPKLFVEYDSL